MIHVKKLLEDYNIDHTETHHHCTPGWVNIHCPFCAGRQNYHLGIHKESGACHCWRCGTHNLVDVVAAVLSVSKSKAVRIIKQYSDLDLGGNVKKLVKPNYDKEIKLPRQLMRLTDRHKEYLRSRGFDPTYLERYFGLQSIGLDPIYRYRIFIPITFSSRLVSFTTRTPSQEVQPRYKTCAKDNEIIHHKYIVYNIDNIPTRDYILVVEGPADVWRMRNAVATFGITYTLPQVLLLSEFKNVFIMFDDEPVAQQQARKLAYEIQLVGNSNTYLIDSYNGDPGSLDTYTVKSVFERIQKLIA